MKKEWSSKWKSSSQPRKQRKYRYNAPLHVRHKFLGARLSPELVKQFGRRSLPVRKGDEVKIMRGSSKDLKGTVERVDVKQSKVYVDGITVKKTDGSEVMKPLVPSNIMITKPDMNDKRRNMILERTEKRKGDLSKSEKTSALNSRGAAGAVSKKGKEKTEKKDK